tara:strand:- start:21 stop:671 length:651 start_codon:yes stop_codon:yes gene_type:complete
LISNIKDNLEVELPGIKSWNRMAVEPIQNNRNINERIINYKEWSSKENVKNMKKAAVLVCFFRRDEEYYFPLIKRPMHERNHPGQIALPGGSMDKNETLEMTALRESFEEVGIESNEVKIIGQMTPLPVPVSKYLIYPFIGTTENEPYWKLNDKEVDELILLKFNDLIKSDNGYYEDWTREDNQIRVPIFKIVNTRIWGATAAILSELIDLSKKTN